MQGKRAQRPPPPYSKLPHGNNGLNVNHESYQTKVPNEDSPLLDRDSETRSFKFILITCALAVSFLFYMQISHLKEPDIKEPPRVTKEQEMKERDHQRHEAGVAWNSPVKGSCVQYASRSHSATLLNYVADQYWLEACERTQMVIRDRIMNPPLKCELADNKVTGYWDVDDGGCRPFFSAKSEECAGSDKLISAQLMYTEDNTHWEDVCMTTPFQLGMKTYLPISCHNKDVDGIWGLLRVSRDAECMRDERIRHRHEIGVFWNTPQFESCLWSGVGKYSTVLLNYPLDGYWKEACETTELLFNGQKLMPPDLCEKYWQDDYKRRIVVGHWTVSNVTECTPFWGDISRDHCVGTNKRMVSSRLWNIKDTKLWDIMCKTTPLTLQGVPQVPLSCENKGWFGMWGHWEIYDDSCNMLYDEHNTVVISQ